MSIIPTVLFSFIEQTFCIFVFYLGFICYGIQLSTLQNNFLFFFKEIF